MKNMAPKKPLISFLHIVITCVMFTRTNTFSIPMIPIDSPKLQMFPQSFSAEQRLHLLTNITTSRASVYSTRSLDSNANVNSIEGTVDAMSSSYYAIQIFFGTSSSGLLSAFLLLDSANYNTWVQCKNCNPCIQLKNENVDPFKSGTYKFLSPIDPRCNPRYTPIQDTCGYRIAYGGGAASIGVMGTDTFVFTNSTTRAAEFFPDLAFGCGYRNSNFNFGLNTGPLNIIAGIFGLSPGPASFITQLDATVKGRFSYCLTSYTEPHQGVSTIHFGDDAQLEGEDVQQVRMALFTGYHIYFTGISVEGNRLDINLTPCKLDTSATNKGFFIDSGTPFTVLPSSIYQPLRAAMVSFFAQYGWAQVSYPFADLCYSTESRGDERFPDVAFHFENAGGGSEVSWAMTKNNMFFDFIKGFCLVITEDKSDTGPCLFGAFQHANFRVLYDYKNLKLAFKHERCQEDQDV